MPSILQSNGAASGLLQSAGASTEAELSFVVRETLANAGQQGLEEVVEKLQ